MLHRYKDRGIDWLRRPLASLLATFLREHAGCIDEDAGGIDLATIVPSDSQTRSFNHIEGLLHGISGDPVLSRFAWSLDAVARNWAVARPERGELRPSAYKVDPAEVEGPAVLLLDDTWTSGASAASTAAALKYAGALHVTVLTLGRQLNAGNHFGSSDDIYNDRHGDLRVRALHLPGQATAVAEMTRVLRPGGRIGITDVTADRDRLPAELTGLGARIACIADARTTLEYEALLIGHGLRVTVSEPHGEALQRMVLQIAARTELLRMTDRARAEQAGLDFTWVPALVRAAQDAVEDGTLGYVLIVAEKSG